MSKFTNAPTTSLKGLVAGCMIKLLLAAVITLLFQVSLMSIATGVGTKEIGYRVLYSADNKEYKEVYLHLYADGEDTQLEKYQQDPHYYKVAERSTLNPGTVLAVNAVACGFGLVLLYFSIYTALWRAVYYQGKRRPNRQRGWHFGAAAGAAGFTGAVRL